jgi:hypothetical protein
MAGTMSVLCRVSRVGTVMVPRQEWLTASGWGTRLPVSDENKQYPCRGGVVRMQQRPCSWNKVAITPSRGKYVS